MSDFKEEQKFAHMQGAKGGYEERGKDFRQEIRNLKKQARRGALSTREEHRLRYLKSLRGRRIAIDSVKAVGEIILAIYTGGGGNAAKAALQKGGKEAAKVALKAAAKENLKKQVLKIGKKQIGKTATRLGSKAAKALARKVAMKAVGEVTGAIAEKKMDKQMETAEGRALRAEAFGQQQGAQDIRRAGAHYTPGLESFIPIAASATSMGLQGGFEKTEQIPEQPSMTGLDEILRGEMDSPKDLNIDDIEINESIPIEEPEEIFYDDTMQSQPVSDTRNFPEIKDRLELERDKSFARRKGIDPTEFEEEEGFGFPESDPILPPEPAPPTTVDPITTIPLQTIDSGATAPSLQTSTQNLPPQKESLSTLAELTTTEYEDILDRINAPQGGLSYDTSDEDILAMENASGMGTYQEMFDQYKENTQLSDEQIMIQIRKNAENAGDLNVSVGEAEVASSEREDFIKQQTEQNGFPPRPEVVDIHMKNWEKNRPERERNSRILMAREQAEALLGEYDIPFDPNEPTPNISYEKGGKLQDHMGSIHETRRYIMNKYK